MAAKIKTQEEQLIDQLLEHHKDAEDYIGAEGILKKLTKAVSNERCKRN